MGLCGILNLYEKRFKRTIPKPSPAGLAQGAKLHANCMLIAPPPTKPKLPGWRTELRLEERRIELAAAAAAKAAADGAADGGGVNDDRIARWTPTSTAERLSCLHVQREGGRNGHDDACLIAHYHAQAPKPQRRGLDRGSYNLHARNYNTRDL